MKPRVSGSAGLLPWKMLKPAKGEGLEEVQYSLIG